MTSSRLEPPTHITGAHRAHSRAPRPTPAQAPPARYEPYEPYLDGLFTYCLSVLCDHDAATAVLGDVLAVAERQHGRCPSREPERRAWLYALARWACLRRLAERKRRRQGAHSGHRAPDPAPGQVSAEADETALRRRRELALLAWPEAAGTTPEQREALELAVRHGLGPREVASVLGMDYPAARELLAAAACEVERTRAALAVVENGGCPIVSRLTGDNQVLLGAALCRELVRHVDDCPRCRRSAERAGAGGPWPGTGAAPATLPLVEAPRAAAYAAGTSAPRTRGGSPRFGRNGFPLDPKDHAARRDRLRTRAVTTTVVATVVAAPVFALWAAYRGAPLTGESHGASVSASEADNSDGLDGDPYGGPGGTGNGAYENTGNARTTPDPRFTAGSRSPDVSVEVVSGGTARPGGPGSGADRLTVEARSAGSTTVVTLRAAGGSPVSWSAWTNASWLYLSQSSGTLAPGETVTLYVSVDHEREPAGPWRARIGVDPTGAVVVVQGHGRTAPAPSSPDPTPPPPSPDPTPPPTTASPTPTAPTTPPPEPTPTDPTTPPPSPDPTPTDATSPAP
ncbi:BACON domain-containing protein [Streptomyces sp. Wb2n-11]|uniref:BACON domain-containing protein n=1 Tax=Streptomyces sp. Wb2n-11 TaxID=1030533 RepID=UPI000B0D6485|nr:sigma-70 family RNA polymerase sigma factor [Streptomyces sp. Wb2n-11]